MIANTLSSTAVVSVPAMGGYSPSKLAGRPHATIVRAELAAQGTRVSALIVGSLDTRMASHVQGRKEAPETIAAAGLRAIREGVKEMDTDEFAVGVREALERAPGKLEASLAGMLGAAVVTTGR